MSVQTVAFEDLILPPRSLRMPSIEDEAVIAMAEDITKRGILNLFTVYDNEDGTFSLGDGHHRYTALELMLSRGEWVDGWEDGELDVNVKPKKEAVDILEDQIAGNSQKKETKKAEYVDAIVYIQKEKGYSLSEIATKVGLTEDYLKSLIKTIRLDDQTRDLIGEGEISITNGVTLAKLYNKVDEAKQDELRAFAQRQTVPEFAETINALELKISEDRKAEAKARKESGEPTPAPVFAPKKQFIGKASLEDMLTEAIEDNSGSEADEAKLLVLKTAFNVNDTQVAEQQRVWEAKQAEKEAKKEAASLKRKQEKLAADEKAIKEAEEALKNA